MFLSLHKVNQLLLLPEPFIFYVFHTFDSIRTLVVTVFLLR